MCHFPYLYSWSLFFKDKAMSLIVLNCFSDDETQALTDPKRTSALENNNVESESKQSVVGAKRPFDSESCSYCM